MLKTFYRKADRQVYFSDIDGELMTAPTLIDGSIALESAAYVADLVEPPPDEEKRFILQYFNGD